MGEGSIVEDFVICFCFIVGGIFLFEFVSMDACGCRTLGCMYVVLLLLLLLDYHRCNGRGEFFISTCVPAGPAIHVVFSFLPTKHRVPIVWSNL